MTRMIVSLWLAVSAVAWGAPASEALYYRQGNDNTEHSFRITVKVNDPAVLAQANQLYSEVELVNLRTSSSPVFLPKQRVTNFGTGWPIAFRVVSNLPETTVFKARMHFYVPQGSTPGSFRKIGGTSNWYYTTTDGPKEKSEARTRIVLKGFYEFDESERGKVGENGTVAVDGTRYGAKKGEKWCSEFYAWAAEKELRGIHGASNVSSVNYYFSRHHALYLKKADIFSVGDRGDYLSMDTDADGDANHSAMFLAPERVGGVDYVWTLEGNRGNKVKVVQRPLSKLKSLGHITYDMLD